MTVTGVINVNVSKSSSASNLVDNQWAWMHYLCVHSEMLYFNVTNERACFKPHSIILSFLCKFGELHGITHLSSYNS